MIQSELYPVGVCDLTRILEVDQRLEGGRSLLKLGLELRLLEAAPGFRSQLEPQFLSA